MTIRTSYNQTLIDVALQGSGDVLSLLLTAQLNGLSITDDITAGEEIITNDAAVDKQKIAAYFNQNANAPCSNGVVVPVAGLEDFVQIQPSVTKDTLRIQEGQTIIDMALQGAGDVERIIEVAAYNGLSITDEIIAGDLFNAPAAAKNKKNIATFFNSSPNYPASGESGTASNNTPEGIGYWYITEPEPIFTVS